MSHPDQSNRPELTTRVQGLMPVVDWRLTRVDLKAGIPWGNFIRTPRLTHSWRRIRARELYEESRLFQARITVVGFEVAECDIGPTGDGLLIAPRETMGTGEQAPCRREYFRWLHSLCRRSVRRGSLGRLSHGRTLPAGPSNDLPATAA